MKNYNIGTINKDLQPLSQPFPTPNHRELKSCKAKQDINQKSNGKQKPNNEDNLNR